MVHINFILSFVTVISYNHKKNVIVIIISSSSSTMHNCFAALRGKITEYYYDKKSNQVTCGVKIELDCEHDTLLTLLSLHTKVA